MLDGQSLTFTLRGPVNNILSPALRKACDRCRKRKTRCDGLDQCTNCAKAGASCSYLTIHKRKGPKPRSQPRGLSSPGQDTVRSSKTSRVAEKSSTTVPEQCLYEIGDDVGFQPLEYTDSTSSETRSTENDSVFSHETLLSSMRSDQSTTDIWEDESSGIPMSWNDRFHPSLTAMVVENSHDTCSDTGCHPSPGIGDLEQDYTKRASDYTQGGQMLPIAVFKPYLTLFFERLYPIFPVLERELLLRDMHATRASEQPISVDQYVLLTSLSAAVIVQLNILNQNCLVDALNAAKISDCPSEATQTQATFFSADFFVAQCLNARKQWEYMDNPDEHTIMTSFFLFEYYGNRNQAHRAWYYLREAIGFALSLGLDEADSYCNLTSETAQRRCRLFWLLFVTERAYALQHKSGVMLRPSIDLPRIFESKDPKLIYGFVNLVTLFKSVDDSFVSAWKGRSLLDTERSSTNQITSRQSFLHLEQTSSRGAEGALVLEIDEVQRLDFMVTQQWLYLLSWQLKNRPNTAINRQMIKSGLSGVEASTGSTLYPFRISKDLLGIINSANRQSLECHGIGMEQKIFDVACCLSDVLGSSQNLGRDTFSAGHQILHGFMTMLASFRNQESRYLQPLLTKAATVLASALPPPMIGNNSNRCEEWQEEQPWTMNHIMQ